MAVPGSAIDYRERAVVQGPELFDLIASGARRHYILVHVRPKARPAGIGQAGRYLICDAM
jgi:hypothetical protein